MTVYLDYAPAAQHKNRCHPHYNNGAEVSERIEIRELSRELAKNEIKGKRQDKR